MDTRVVSFHYTLKNKTGETLDSSREAGEPMMFLEGSESIIPGLESELLKMKNGEQKIIHVKAGEAYGEHDPRLVFDIPRDRFPKDQPLQMGDQFQANFGGGENGEAGQDEDEEQPSPVFTITGVTDAQVSVDGNHPLAGQDLQFEVELVEIRNATEEELQHGHAHGGDGHHHH